MSTPSIITLGLLATLLTACMSQHPGPRAADGGGFTWAHLSTDTSLLPELREGAEQTGCTTLDDYPAEGEVTIVCGAEQLIVQQRRDWLGYRCSTLRGSACHRMVMHLTTCRHSGRFAERGSSRHAL